MATITLIFPSIAHGVPCKLINGKANDTYHIFPSCGVKLLAQANQPASKKLNELLKQGRKLVEAGNYKLAIAIYQRAISLDPKNAQIYSGIGYLEARQENFPVAAQFYQQAIAIEPNNANFQYGLGYTMARLENYQAAVAAYRRASVLDKNNICLLYTSPSPRDA